MKKSSDKKQIFFSKNNKGQVWVETVVYTLIAFVLIGLVLAYAKPKIEEIQDKAIIEQSIGIIKDINTVFFIIEQGGSGNTRLIQLEIKKGTLKIDGKNNSIIFEMESRHTYSEPGENVNIEGIEVHTEKKGKINIVTLTSNHSEKYDLTYQEKDELKLISKTVIPFNLLISNKGTVEGKTTIDIQTTT